MNGDSAVPAPSYAASEPFSVSLVTIGAICLAPAPTVLAKGALAPLASACSFSAVVSTEGTREEGKPTKVGVGEVVDMDVRGCRSVNEVNSDEERSRNARLPNLASTVAEMRFSAMAYR